MTEDSQSESAVDECRLAFEQEFEPRGFPISHNGTVYESHNTEMAYRGFEAAWHYGEPKTLIREQQLPVYTTSFTPAGGFRLRQDGDVVYHEPIPKEPTI